MSEFVYTREYLNRSSTKNFIKTYNCDVGMMKKDELVLLARLMIDDLIDAKVLHRGQRDVYYANILTMLKGHDTEELNSYLCAPAYLISKAEELGATGINNGAFSQSVFNLHRGISLLISLSWNGFCCVLSAVENQV